MALPTPVNGQITDSVTQTIQNSASEASNQTTAQEKDNAGSEAKSDSKES